MQRLVNGGVVFVHCNGVVDGVRDDKIEVHGGGDFVEHFKHGIKHVVDVNVQHLDENIAFVVEISIDDARGNARFFAISDVFVLK